jgi:hypothetical protein
MPPKKKFNPERRERRAELRQQRLGQTFNHVTWHHMAPLKCFQMQGFHMFSQSSPISEVSSGFS